MLQIVHSRNYLNFIFTFIVSCVYALLFISHTQAWFSAVFLLFVNYFTAMFFYFAIDNYKILKVSSFAPFYFVVAILWFSDFLELNYWNKLVAFGLFFLFFRIFHLSRHAPYYFQITDMGIVVGIFSCFDAGFMLYMVLVYSAILLLKEFRWQNIIIPLLGFSIPLLYYVTFLYVQDVIDDISIPQKFYRNNLVNERLYSPAFLLVYVGIVIAFPRFLSEVQSNIVTKRKMLNLFLINGLLGIIFFLLSNNISLSIVLIAPSLSMIYSPATYSYTKKWVSLTLFWLMLFIPVMYVVTLKLKSIL